MLSAFRFYLCAEGWALPARPPAGLGWMMRDAHGVWKRVVPIEPCSSRTLCGGGGSSSYTAPEAGLQG